MVEFEKKRLELDRDMTRHLAKLTDFIQNPFAQNSQSSGNLHHTPEVSMAGFVKDFKSAKKEVFIPAERAMESEKSKYLLATWI